MQLPVALSFVRDKSLVNGWLADGVPERVIKTFCTEDHAVYCDRVVLVDADGGVIQFDVDGIPVADVDL